MMMNAIDSAPRPKSDRRAGKQHDQRRGKDNGALSGRTHAFIPNGGSRPLTRQYRSARTAGSEWSGRIGIEL